MGDDTAESAASRAYRLIRDQILEGVLLPGTMLSESVLAVETGLSRTPVRAAIARLRDEGWLTVFPKRGALVRGLTDAEIDDLAHARFAVESSSVSMANANDRRRLAVTLTNSVEKQAVFLTARDLGGFIESTIDFHRSFVEVSGNGVMLELNDRLADRQRYLLFLQGDRLLNRSTEIIDEHVRLVEQLASTDARGFTEALRGHITGADGAPLPRLP